MEYGNNVSRWLRKIEEQAVAACSASGGAIFLTTGSTCMEAVVAYLEASSCLTKTRYTYRLAWFDVEILQQSQKDNNDDVQVKSRLGQTWKR